MKIAMLTTGDELLDGRVVNTNLQFIGQELFRHGQRLDYVAVVPDDLAVQVRQIQMLTQDYDLLVITGGLGPTSDDVTRTAVAQALCVPLVFDAVVLTRMQEKFEQLGRPMPDSNRQQAYFPAGATPISNTLGSADGFDAHIGDCAVVVLPGVPAELVPMWHQWITIHPGIFSHRQWETSRLIRLYGLGESAISDRVQDLLARYADIHMAFQCFPAEVHLRLAASPRRHGELATFESELIARLRPFIYGFDAQTFWERFHHLCLHQNITVAVAESCTGGMVMQELTAIPDASFYLRGGVVAYQTRTKSDMLTLSPDLIAAHGVVSGPVAAGLAEAVAKKCDARMGISVTGFAGPTTAPLGPPVGTVFVACWLNGKACVTHHVFPGNRHQVRVRAAYAAIHLAYETMST